MNTLTRISLVVLAALSVVTVNADDFERRVELLQQVLTLPDKQMDKGSPEHVAAKLLHYYKTRSAVKHPALVGAVAVSERDQKWADDALEHIFVGQPNYPSFFCGEDIDWKIWPVPDKEWNVQLHRMYFWNAMAKVYSKTKDERYAKEWSAQLIDWVQNNPRDDAHAYAWRTLEAGKRGHSWTEVFLRFIESPHFTEETLVYFLSSLHDHASFILKAKYNSKSNWALMQAEGLAYIGFVFPEFKDAELWRNEGIRRLNEALDQQVYRDGHQRELCIGYHVGSIGWLTRTLRLAEINDMGALFPESYHTRIERMCEVPMKLCLPNGTNVQFGDTTEAGKPGQYAERYRKWAEIYDRDDFRFIATGGEQGSAPEATAFALKQSGLYSMRNSWEPDAISLVLKCGPDGGFHCQPDNGTFDVYAGGRNLMPDSGSYTYSKSEGMKEWRDWFRQTKAHQTLTLNGQNTRYAPKLLKWETGETLDILSVENQSYQNLTHRRTVYFVDKRFFVVLDEAIGTATGDVDIHFQLAPGEAVFDQDNYSVRSDFKDGWNVWVHTQEQAGLELASEEGWVSFVYTEKEERPAFRYRLKKTSEMDSVRFCTVVAPYQGEVPEIQVELMDAAESGVMTIQVRENAKTWILGESWRDHYSGSNFID